jgi:hypothetical protein
VLENCGPIPNHSWALDCRILGDLAALAYNVGESQVQTGIEKTGSRDAWVLIREGLQNDRDYLPKLMAAILIMKNPGVVQ